MKQCTKCKQWKDESEFPKRKDSKDGLRADCRECNLKAKREHYAKPETKALKKQYDLEHKEQRVIYAKAYYNKNKERQAEYAKEYYTKTRKKRLAYNKLDYVVKRKEELRQKNLLNSRLSATLNKSIKHNCDSSYCFTLFGFSLQQLKEHLESQFTPEMNWNNYGSYWEIDHIIPQNTFNITSPEDKDFQVCWSLANLRPLERSLNRQRPKDGSDISEELKYKILIED